MTSKTTRFQGEDGFHRFFDPLDAYLRPDEQSRWVWNDRPSNRLEGHLYLEDLLRVVHRFQRRCKSRSFYPGEIETLESALGVLERSGLPNVPSVSGVMSLYSFVSRLSIALAVILKVARPGCILTQASFSSVLGFGLSRAGEIAGVPLVEMQHGQQGPDHSFLSVWHHYPIEGYHFMPSHYWVWGEVSGDRVRNWLPQEQWENIIEGGNTWLAMRKGRAKSEKPEHCLNVLVALQLEGVPKQVIDAMKCPDNAGVTWFLRLHPVFGRAELVEEQLMGVDSVTWSIDEELDLYESLRDKHILLADYSTVCIEALFFGVRVGLTSAYGLRELQEFVSEGAMTDVSTLAKLNCFLSVDSPTDAAEVIAGRYMSSSEDRVEEAVARVKSI